MQTQNKQLMQYLNKTGNYLTTMKIMRMFCIASPTRRISDLRALGYKIETTFVTKDGKRYAEWRKGK